MALFLAPVCQGQAIDVDGNPRTGGKIYTYLAGTSTPTATYTTEAGSTPHANPIILNSLGQTPNPIWITSGLSYKFVETDSADVVIRTTDNIDGVNDTTQTASEWFDSGFTPTYISAVSFSVPGDQTSTLQIGRRLKTTNTGGAIYSTITNSVFGALTTVTVTNDSGTLDAGLSLVAYGLLSATNPSVPATYAKIASPTFTGTPAAPTAAVGTNTTQLATTAFVLANNVPAGTIIDFAGTTAPSGYLACPTTATNISRATYATLFAAIGTTWGAGDGSTTFGCPWFPANYAAVQANANVGTATVGVMPAHTHPLSIQTLASFDGGNASRNFKVVGSGDATSSTGTGADNLAAGHRVLKCVKL